MQNNWRIKLLVGIVLLVFQSVSAQQNDIIPDLTNIMTSDGWNVVNREAEIIDYNGKSGVYFKSDNKQGGVA